MRCFVGTACLLIGCSFTNTADINGGGDDAGPTAVTVEFEMAQTTVTETPGGMNVDLAVRLSEASTRSITVMFNTSGSAGASDFSIVNASVTIPSGMTTGSMRLRINDDLEVEGGENVLVTITQTSFGAAIGAQNTHSVLIGDNDSVCYGEGAFAVCFTSAPTGSVVLPALIDTDSSLCAMNQPMGWTGAQMQPASCFIIGETIDAPVAVSVSGSRPLVLVAANSIAVNSIIDVSSHRMPLVVGPGSPSSACNTPADLPGSDSSGGGGGAGGSFFSSGNRGGNGKPGTQGGQAAPAEQNLPLVLRAGCNGQRGQQGDNAAGVAGRGGGAIYLVAGQSITVSAVGGINASGSAGTGGGDSSGGSGGGSGGTIKLHAPSMTFVVGSRLFANGGGGSSGADDNVNGANGAEASVAMPTMSAPGGTGPADGGGGFAGTTGATPGDNAGGASDNAGGGGGGGGGGLIESNQPYTNAVVSAGRVVP